MELSKITTGIIMVTVAVMMCAVLVFPVISDVSETEATVDNTGYFHMEKYGTDSEVTIEWDHTKPKIFTVNGEDKTVTLPFNLWASVVVGDNWYLRYADGNTVQFTQTTYGGINYVSASTTDGKDLKVVCSNGTATITPYTSGVAGTSSTATYTELYVISGDTGAYVMKKSDAPANMAPDTAFVALGSTGLTGSDRCICRIDGSVKDGAEVVIVASTVDPTTASDVEVNATELSGYVGYSLSSITFVISANGSDTDATYSYFIVPSKVTLELDEHLSSSQIVILAIIPILLLVSVIVVVARMIGGRAD